MGNNERISRPLRDAAMKLKLALLADESQAIFMTIAAMAY